MKLANLLQQRTQNRRNKRFVVFSALKLKKKNLNKVMKLFNLPRLTP